MWTPGTVYACNYHIAELEIPSQIQIFTIHSSYMVMCNAAVLYFIGTCTHVHAPAEKVYMLM